MTAEIFINLKRFEVPRSMGGVCPVDNPYQWIDSVIRATVEYGLGEKTDVNIVYLLPEGLLRGALQAAGGYPSEKTRNLSIGVQGIYRENIAPGKNFGAFTTNLPASSALQLGATWAIIGHSEERKDKTDIMCAFEPAAASDENLRQNAAHALDTMINQEVRCCLQAGINALVCIGETAEERGDGSFDEQKPRIRDVLHSQLEIGLRDVAPLLSKRKLIIGYEPRWAIGPGKTPPGADYIVFVSSIIKETVASLYGFTPPVVYGGGLKEENAKMLADIDTINGGLVALTQFTGDFGFYPAGLKKIVDIYLGA